MLVFAKVSPDRTECRGRSAIQLDRTEVLMGAEDWTPCTSSALSRSLSRGKGQHKLEAGFREFEVSFQHVDWLASGVVILDAVCWMKLGHGNFSVSPVPKAQEGGI